MKAAPGGELLDPCRFCYFRLYEFIRRNWGVQRNTLYCKMYVHNFCTSQGRLFLADERARGIILMERGVMTFNNNYDDAFCKFVGIESRPKLLSNYFVLPGSYVAWSVGIHTVIIYFFALAAIGGTH